MANARSMTGVSVVDHERDAHVGAEAPENLLHVRDFVAPHVGDADVEDVAAFRYLFARHPHHAVDVAGFEQTFELTRAVRVGAFTDEEQRRILTQGLGAVEARDGRFPPESERRARAAAEGFRDFGEVGRGRSAAAADDRDAEVVGEACEPTREFGGESG
jgi:hypothetical protein